MSLVQAGHVPGPGWACPWSMLGMSKVQVGLCSWEYFGALGAIWGEYFGALGPMLGKFLWFWGPIGALMAPLDLYVIE